ncbi:MAG: DUF808 domain-containing protein [Alphaproteobacteria bacterium]|nr:DUF808 domain-containing protein [Alphaproteobacteria bacterium]
MASGLLALLDDITVLLDDVAAMSKIAAKKTAGIVGDDLAVNANAVVGIDPKRELPIVGKIALGSLVNKAILIPLALILPAKAIPPLLMFGGAFLCFEAFHKMTHKKDEKDEEHHQKMVVAIQDSPEALLKLENKKIWGAIGTDTILSAEIIAVSLGAIAAAPLMTQALTLSVIGIGMTVGVYGLVACIVKFDDWGLKLQQVQGTDAHAKMLRAMGTGLVNHTPTFMRVLSVVGTTAMFAVGGGILVHGIPGAEAALKSAVAAVTNSGFIGGTLNMAGTIVAGMIAGCVSMPFFGILGKGIDKMKPHIMRTFGALRKAA